MYRYFLTLLFPLFLFANLNYESNFNKELALLDSFDIEPSFLYDPIMNQMRTKNSSVKKSKHFFRTMDNAYIFIPTIKNTLTKYNVPQEFLYLAMAESNFKTRAYSPKRAAGLWQFMPRTGRVFNLKID
jgi:membrane-bound lytic murein transglycosylase D